MHESEQRAQADSTLQGADSAPEDRPGVPMEAEPHSFPGSHWDEPGRQPGGDRHLTRAALDRPTPVFGTAQPPHGLSGVIRRGAYGIPEHYARHWLLLMLADRVDVLEHRLGALGRGAEGERAYLAPALALGAATLTAVWIAKRLTD